jgi:fatty-acyl-CoA synthase
MSPLASARFFPRGLPQRLSPPATSLWFNLEVSATRFPERPALAFYGGVTNYREFREQAEHLAGFLQAHCGVKRGERVALFLHNSPQYVIGYYAILRADAVVVPINCMNTTSELEHILRDSGATVVIAAQELLPRVQPLLGGAVTHAVAACYADYAGDVGDFAAPEIVTAPRKPIALPDVTAWHAALDARREPAPHSAGPDDLALIPYTSGTTGKPKGCMHRHRGIMHSAMSIAHWHDVRHDACSLAVLPLFHVTGMQNSMNMPIYAGATIVLLPRWNREVALRLIERYRVTNLTTVPAMIVDLVAGLDASGADISSLRMLGGGGAAMPPAVAAKLLALLGRTYLEGYGLTETMAGTHMNPSDRPKAGCLGIPIFDMDARIIDPVTREELPQGAVGEIVMAGPQVLDGYWNNAQENENCFTEIGGKSFFRTGDLARIDEDGYFFFVDRLKRMINAAGFKVWPAEVESQLYAHPAVQEACVIGKKDPRSGEVVKALIVLKADARDTTPDSVIEWSRANMAAYKVPRHVQFVAQLPRSATGKIDWRLLQEQESASP